MSDTGWKRTLSPASGDILGHFLDSSGCGWREVHRRVLRQAQDERRRRGSPGGSMTGRAPCEFFDSVLMVGMGHAGWQGGGVSI